MKKTTKLFVAAAIATVGLIAMGCKTQLDASISTEEASKNLSEMKSLRTDTLDAMKKTIANFGNADLLQSEVFTVQTNSRSAMEKCEFVNTDDELIENLTEEEAALLESLADEYYSRVTEVAKNRIFDTNNMPEGVLETDTEVIIADYCYLKTIPEEYEKVLEFARDYYGNGSRGAVLHGSVGSMTFDGWPFGNVSYGFDNFPSGEKSNVRKCMDEWSVKTGSKVRFLDNGDFNWWTRIKWVLGVYRVLRITNESLSGGTLGQTTPGRLWAPYMKLDTAKLIKLGSVQKLHTYRHELGHAIGLQHEFDRFDRDNYVVWDRIDKTWADISVSAVGRFFISSYGPYDYNSVMNYGSCYCRKNSDGSKGELITLNDIKDISQGDIDAVKSLYFYVR